MHATKDFRTVIEFFESGGNLKFSDTDSTKTLLEQLSAVPSLMNFAGEGSDTARVAEAEFILEGLYANDKIGRSEERGFIAIERRPTSQDMYTDYTMERARNKKPLN